MLNVRCLVQLVVLLCATEALGQSAPISNAPLPDDVLVIRRHISAQYNPSTKANPSVEKLNQATVDSSSPDGAQSLVQDSLTKTLVTRRRDSLSALISRQYGVGTTNAAAMYAAISSKIVSANGLPSPDNLPANTRLAIPDLPRIARTSPGASNLNNFIPKLSIDTRLLQGTAAAAAASPTTRDISVNDDLRPAAQEVTQIRAIVASALDSKNADQYEFIGAPLAIQFEQAAGGPPAPLSREETDVLSAKSGAPVQKQTVLIVLDDSWPDDESFRSSRDFLIQAIKNVRAKKHLPPPVFSPALLNATSANMPGKAQGSGHASLIKRSITTVSTLFPQNPVKVVFVPLFTSQNGAAEILSHLVAISLIFDHDRADFGIPISNRDNDAYIGTAVAIVSNISKIRMESVPRTDQAVVQAVFTLSYLLSEIDQTPYFLSLSWTTPKLQFEIPIPSLSYGLTIVAAGNHGNASGVTPYDREEQFISRSWRPGDMLGVMNVKDDGSPDCDSSPLQTGRSKYVVSFPGRLSSNECGTSFSAPRVAWLIAAHEALKPSIASNGSWARRVGDWQEAIKDRLLSLQDAAKPAFNQIRFDIGKFYSDIP